MAITPEYLEVFRNSTCHSKVDFSLSLFAYNLLILGLCHFTRKRSEARLFLMIDVIKPTKHLYLRYSISENSRSLTLELVQRPYHKKVCRRGFNTGYRHVQFGCLYLTHCLRSFILPCHFLPKRVCNASWCFPHHKIVVQGEDR